MASLASIEEWLCDSSDALQMSLVAPSPSGLQTIGYFSPKFTYPIFGEEEKIFGYKDLKISLKFRANDMRPHVKVSCAKKYKPIGETEAQDVLEILGNNNHLPKVAFSKLSEFEADSRQQSRDWKPPGELQRTLAGPDGEYEIWRGNLADPAIKQLNSRIQILVTTFIEGGSYIGANADSDDGELDLSDADRWTFFAMYRKQPAADDPTKSSYTFIGYSTVYRFYYFSPPTPPASPQSEWELPQGTMDLAEMPCRTRLSQFVILPPFHGKGNGQRLYNTIFDYYQKHPQTQEFTVEDPNESFDDLRDVCDLAFLQKHTEFKALRLNPDVKLDKTGSVPKLVVGAEKLDSLRLKTKIAPRQFGRVLELYLMSQLPQSVRPSMEMESSGAKATKEDNHLKKLWDLLVKQRLYRHNKDVLSQIEVDERIEKLQETLKGVELDYARLLAAFERSQKNAELAQATNGKRKHDGDETPASKRARASDA